jgi:hypothetical protein
MSCFANNTQAVQGQAPDPTRHVNYVQGMVLGVDDFTQEFAYLSGRTQWLVRDLAGYGTIRGLKVQLTDTGLAIDQDEKWKVSVSPGTAADPCGRLICVPESQCGHLNKWLAQHLDEVDKALGNVVAGTLSLYLVLAYRDCTTDAVPIPGEPCRSEDQLTADSRIADDFLLDLSLTAPKQPEEDGLRQFTQWLHSIPLEAGATAGLTHQAFADAVAAWKPGDTVAPALLKLGQDDAADYLRDALRVWVTELRPLVYGRVCGCAADPKGEHEENVLLAQLMVDVEKPIGKPWRVKIAPTLDQRQRPLLIHARVLAEDMVARASAQLLAPVGPVAILPPLPAPGPALRVVAAGKLRGDNTTDGPTIGKLQVTSLVPGVITLTFDGYAKPAGQHQYIVHALGISTSDIPAPVLRFQAFTNQGIELRVNPSAKARTAVTVLQKLEFMLDVSEISVAP